MRAWWGGVLVGLVASMLASGVARADNGLIAIDEVLGSWQGDETAQFIELRMLAAGQNGLSAGADVIIDDATGSAAGRRVFSFPSDVANGAVNARILIATTRFADIAAFEPDFTLPIGVLSPRAGRVCYRVNPPQPSGHPVGVLDCVAYGAFRGNNGPFGSPTPFTPDNRSLQRVELTGVNVTDWVGVLQPTPQSNAGKSVVLDTFCGNAVINQGEQCDGTNLGGATCASLDFARGTLHCDQCHFDARECSTCGNDTINGDETCDGTDLGGQTCAALGFTGGILGCTDECRLTTAGCDPTYFVPGGGPPGPECLAEWRIMNAAHRPAADGRAPVRQRCKDGDVGCDADATTGTCTFTIALCFDRDDARFAQGNKSCRRPPIESWTMLKPALDDGTDAAALLAAVAALGPSTTAGSVVTFAPALDGAERCTAPLSITVATRGRKPGVRVLRARTAGAGGRPRDVDALKLVCAP